MPTIINTIIKKILLIILSPIIFTCCTSREGKIIQQEEKVMIESPDSANQMLLQIVPSNLNNERIKAYYALINCTFYQGIVCFDPFII